MGCQKPKTVNQHPNNIMSKIKFPSHINYGIGGAKTLTKLTFVAFLAAFKKDTEMPSDQTEKLVAHYLTKGGAEDPDLSEIEDKKLQSWTMKCWKFLVKSMIAHEKAVKAEMDAAAAEKRKKEEEDAKKKAESEKLILAAAAGAKTAAVVITQQTDENIRLLIGKKLRFDEGKLTVADGATITKEDFSKAIRATSDATDRASTMRGRLMLVLGQQVLLARELFGDEEADELITQAVAERGQAKHTVQDAARVAGFVRLAFKDKEVPGELTYTHLQELKNHLQDREGKLRVKPAQVVKLAEEISLGNPEEKVTKGDGTTEEARKPLSAAVTRQLCKKLTGDDEKPATPKAPKAASGGNVSDKGFLYVEEDGTVYWSEQLSKFMCRKNGVVVIDIFNRTTLDENGEDDAKIGELPVEFTDPVEPIEVKSKKVAKEEPAPGNLPE